MRKITVLIFFMCFLLNTYFVFGTEKDSLTVSSSAKKSRLLKNTRRFSELEKFDKEDEVIVATNRFTESGYVFNSSDSIQDKKTLKQAKKAFDIIEKTNNFIDFLTTDKLSQLPVAIKPIEISNVKYTVGIAKASFKPTYTELTVFLKIQFPDRNQNQEQILILGANDIKLSHKGGIIGDAKLNLISRFTLNYNSGKMLLTLNGSFSKPSTYATINCSGFKEMSLDANLKFADGFIYPVEKDGTKRRGYVEADFKTVIADWNDLIVNISLPEFGVKGLGKTTFSLNTAIFDFSDLRNDEETPSAYVDKYYSDMPNLWRGVYVKSLKVILPPEFKTKKDPLRKSFGATNLIIDEQGVTGTFFAENMIPLKEGTASGWNFSLDKFLIDIEANSVKTAEFDGKIVLPVAKKDVMEYKAIFQENNYNLVVSNEKDMDFDLWKAKVILNPNSYLELKVKDNKFRPKANLSGSLSIAASLGSDQKSTSNKKGTAVDFKGIRFQNMVLQTESPIFSIGSFGLEGRLKLAGFPIAINEIDFQTTSDYEAKLALDLTVNLTSNSDGGNGGTTKLSIKARNDVIKRDGEIVDNNWKFAGVDIDKLDVKMEVSGTQLRGSVIIFDNDPIYGTGFSGAVKAKFTKGIDLEVKAKALFGRTSDFRYWFADAKVKFPSGIPVFTGFSMNSFGGGIYSRMKMAGVNNSEDAVFNSIGTSSSGVIYQPNRDNYLGMKASVGIVSQGSEDLFHADLEFGMAFRDSGGIQDIYLKGHGELLSPLPEDFQQVLDGNMTAIASNKKIDKKIYSSAIAADVFIGYDFDNRIFHATAEVYVNFGIVKGSGNGGKAGWLEFYSSPSEWNLLVGTPDNRIGLMLDLGLLKAKSESYFMAGDNLPGSPPPPNIVSSILDLNPSDLDYMRKENMLKSGKGLAFGSSFSTSTGDLSLAIFYARFDAGFGFDIMLKDYGNAHCEGASTPLGMNGWYANGQAYAYLRGELGVDFKIFGKKRKIPIIAGDGAVLLQAKLPNPSWFRGYLGGHYNLLGGLIKGKYRFKLEFGKQCKIVGGSPIEGMVVIGDLKPKKGSTDIDVFAAPKAVFNVPVNKVFEFPGENGVKKYKVLLDKFYVKDKGVEVHGKVEWNYNNDVAVFYSHEILPPHTKLEAYVQVSFQEYTNGTWKKIKGDDGKDAIEKKKVVFTTGEAPKTIPLHNVNYMYPVLGQKNYFPKQYPKGYISLKRGQSYLFNKYFTGWRKIIRLKTTNGDSTEKDFSYSEAKKMLTFDTSNSLLNNTNYTIAVALISPSENIDANINKVVEKKKYTDEGSEEYTNSFDGKNNDKKYDNTLLKTSKNTDKEGAQSAEQALLEYAFKTSVFNTFKQKMNAMTVNAFLFAATYNNDVFNLSNKVNHIEAFDLIELRGNQYSGNLPLVRTKALMQDTYYKKDIKPLLYQEYPLLGKLRVSRNNTNKIGVIPIYAVEPMTWYITQLEQEIYSDVNFYNPYKYYLAYYYYRDFYDLRGQLVNSYGGSTGSIPKRYNNLINKPFPIMSKGNYETEFRYVLPGNIDRNEFSNRVYKMTF